MKGICLPEGMINDSAIVNLILTKGLRILIRDANDYLFYRSNKEKLLGSMVESEDYKKANPELILYIDEPISTPETWKSVTIKYPDTIFGELTDKAFDQLSGAITYTAYTKLIDVFGWFRIPIPFTTQLSTWENIDRKYPNRMKLVWIKLGQRDFRFMQIWARASGKDIWYYVPGNMKLETLKKYMETL
jgi:hypothetical protein